MPSAFLENQAVWSTSYFRTDEQVADFFNANNITVYDSQASGGLEFPEHDTVTGGLPSGQQLDVWWDYAEVYEYGGVYEKALGISYETQHWFMGIWQYWTFERLHYTSLKAGTTRGDYIFKPYIIEDFEQTKNGTGYMARCNSGMYVSILYTGNGTGTLSESWDAGQLAYMISWELNASASSVNMFTLLGQILTFQAPMLGVPSVFGDILNAMIAIPVYATTAFIIYKILAGIAPWFSGGSGD